MNKIVKINAFNKGNKNEENKVLNIYTINYFLNNILLIIWGSNGDWAQFP